MAAAPAPPSTWSTQPQAPAPPSTWGTTPGQGGQPMVNQMGQQAPTQPTGPPAPTYEVLWPNGIGWTSRDLSDNKDPKSCRPYCNCCTLPIQFHSADTTMHGAPGTRSRNICCDWTITDADLLGKKFDFHYESNDCCGCSDVVTVSENGSTISTTQILKKINPKFWCNCEVQDIVLVQDAQGQGKFARRDSVCCQKNFGRYSSLENGCCSWHQIRHPFYKAGSTVPIQQAKAIGFVTYRYHNCTPCYYEYQGLDEVPNTLTPDEQKMILGLMMDPTIATAPADNNQ